MMGKVGDPAAATLVVGGHAFARGGIRTGLVYVLVPGEPGPFLVPFGAYDGWSLRDRYNEAIRIMNTLGI